MPLCLWLPFESYRMTPSRASPRRGADRSVRRSRELLLGGRGLGARSARSGRASFGPIRRWPAGCVIGPAWNIGRYLSGEGRASAAGDRLRRRIWAWHVLGVAAVLFWVVGVCHINLALLPVRHRLSGHLDPAAALLRRAPGRRRACSSAPPSSRTAGSSARCSSSTISTPPITSGR